MRILCCFFALICGITSSIAQFEIPPIPKEQTSLYDYTNLLTPAQKNALESKLVRYADSTSTQIVVVIIESTQGEDISFLGAKWGQKWGIGQANEDNGILITLAKGDRKIDINTGYGIEYRLTDLMAERIINRTIIPQFKSGNYYGGLDQGADAIFATLNGEFKETREFTNEEGFPPELLFLLLFLFIIFIIAISAKKNGRGGGGSGTKKGSSLLDVIILSNMGRTGGFGSGGFGGGSSSGGGFSGGFGGGFGGGGFGGGGASGGW